jgi:hypothetical protein
VLGRVDRRARRGGPPTARLRLGAAGRRTLARLPRGSVLTLEVALLGRSGRRAVVRRPVRIVARAGRR